MLPTKSCESRIYPCTSQEGFGSGESDDGAEADSFHEHEPFNVNVTGDVGFDDIVCARTNVPATEATQ